MTFEDDSHVIVTYKNIAQMNTIANVFFKFYQML